MRRKDHGIEGTICACKNLDSQVPVRMKNTQKLQTCTWYQIKRIYGKAHNLQWHNREDLDNHAPKFSGLTRLTSAPNTSLGAVSKLCLSCVYRAESLLAEDVQDGWCPEPVPQICEEVCCQRRPAVRSCGGHSSLHSHCPSPVAWPGALFITQGE